MLGLLLALAAAGPQAVLGQSGDAGTATRAFTEYPAAWRSAVAYGDPSGMDAFSSQVTGNVGDWTSFDKLQHVTFSFLFTLSVQYALVNKLDVAKKTATPFSAGSSFAVGLTKELYDRHLSSSGRFDVKDLVADVVGIMLATGLILL